MANRYSFTGKDGVSRTFIGDRPPTPGEMADLERAESGSQDTSNLSRLVSMLPAGANGKKQNTYEVTAPNGKQLTLIGDRMPTEAELHEIFKQAGVETGALPDTSNLARLASMARDLGVGFAKGAAHTALDAGQLVRAIPGVATATDAAGNAIGGAAGKMLYGTKAAPVSGDTAFQQAKDDTQYTNATQTGGGALETLAEMAVPVSKGIKAIPRTKRAGKAFQSVMGAAKSSPVDISSSGQVALRIQELADRGASMPLVVRKFLNRITSPTGGPMTYEEARDFASNISRLSANEYQRLSPVVAREVAGLRVALNKSIGDAAQAAGKGAEYASAMKEYAQAQMIKGVRDDAWQGVKRAFPYAGGAGAGLYLAQTLKDLIGGQDK